MCCVTGARMHRASRAADDNASVAVAAACAGDQRPLHTTASLAKGHKGKARREGTSSSNGVDHSDESAYDGLQWDGGTQQQLQSLSDLRRPAAWYPVTRMRKRKVILHVGPTNSGKTYRALQALKNAETGIYCGPLRLLAWEVHERLNEGGTPCDLITGQEREEVPDSRHVSATVEMVSVEEPVSVAVLDEIQMVGDRDRGWAWTRVLLGVQADELHCCGDPSAVPLVQRILADTGDEVTVHRYDRLSPLAVASSHVRSMADLRRGDCVVAFGRRYLYDYKKQIEQTTGLRVGMIYGALPPAVRREQARRFNASMAATAVATTASNSSSDAPPSETSAQVDVLVATDAVGMGLNLNIARIVFSKTSKFDGVSRRRLTISEMKQIGGRAGRFGSAYPTGVVSSFQKSDVSTLSHALGQSTPLVSTAGLLPTQEHVQSFILGLAPEWMRYEEAGEGEDEGASEGDTGTGEDGWQSGSDEAEEAITSRRQRLARMMQELEADTDSDSGSDSEVDDGDPAEVRSSDTEADEGARSYTDTRSTTSRIGAVAVDADGDRRTRRHNVSIATDDGDDSGSDSDLDVYRPRPRPARGGDGATTSYRVVLPASQVVERVLETLPYSAVLKLFSQHATVDSRAFFLCDMEELSRVAKLLDDVPDLPFDTRYAFCLAPVDADDALVATALRRYATRFCEKGRVRVGLRIPLHPPSTPGELEELESAHAVFDLYIWLARKFPVEFVSLEEALESSKVTQELIMAGLERMGDKYVRVGKIRAAEAARLAAEAERQKEEEVIRKAARKLQRKGEKRKHRGRYADFDDDDEEDDLDDDDYVDDYFHGGVTRRPSRSTKHAPHIPRPRHFEDAASLTASVNDTYRGASSADFEARDVNDGSQLAGIQGPVIVVDEGDHLAAAAPSAEVLPAAQQLLQMRRAGQLPGPYFRSMMSHDDDDPSFEDAESSGSDGDDESGNASGGSQPFAFAHERRHAHGPMLPKASAYRDIVSGETKKQARVRLKASKKAMRQKRRLAEGMVYAAANRGDLASLKSNAEWQSIMADLTGTGSGSAKRGTVRNGFKQYRGGDASSTHRAHMSSETSDLAFQGDDLGPQTAAASARPRIAAGV